MVAADGRNSRRVRAEVGFPIRRDADCLTIAGILYRDLALPDDAIEFVLSPEYSGYLSSSPSATGAFAPMSHSATVRARPLAAAKTSRVSPIYPLQPVRRRIGSAVLWPLGHLHRSMGRTDGLTARIATGLS